MKAISLWQPRASLLLDPAAKVHETRDWKPPDSYIGETIAIHAAIARRRHGVSPAVEEIARERLRMELAELPRGCILGVAKLVDWQVTHLRRPAHYHDGLCGDWTPGRWAWRFAEPRLLDEPITCRGYQRFFSVSDNILLHL